MFENTDSLYNFKYSSSDVYNDLKIGKCYTLRVYGWRIPFFSWYRNIIDLEPIDTPDEQTWAPQVGETQKPVETLEQTSSWSTQQVQSEIITQEITETPSEAVTDEVTETPVVENWGDVPLEDKAQ